MENTSVINQISEFKPAKAAKSLLQLIKESSTKTEVAYFIDMGKSYKTASDKTRKMWSKAADEKLAVLGKK